MTQEIALAIACGVIVLCTIVCGMLILLTKYKVEQLSRKIDQLIVELFKYLYESKNKN